jgi:hypothetical protein
MIDSITDFISIDKKFFSTLVTAKFFGVVIVAWLAQPAQRV